jgi:hypothetical protein
MLRFLSRELYAAEDAQQNAATLVVPSVLALPSVFVFFFVGPSGGANICKFKSGDALCCQRLDSFSKARSLGWYLVCLSSNLLGVAGCQTTMFLKKEEGREECIPSSSKDG